MNAEQWIAKLKYQSDLKRVVGNGCNPTPAQWLEITKEPRIARTVQPEERKSFNDTVKHHFNELLKSLYK